MKTCTKCKQSKIVDLFSKDKSRKDGLALHCKECVSNYYQTNSDRIKQNVKQYSEKHKEDVLFRTKQWAKANPEKCREFKRRHYELNKNKFRQNSKLRKVLERKAVPPWFEKDQVELLYKKAIEFGFHVDHIVPIRSKTVCGLHCWHNLQLLHPTENMKKGNRWWPDMME